LRNAHIDYLLLYPNKLNIILNEYLFFMNTKFKYYEDRIIKINKNKTSKIYSTDHLFCFERLVCSDEVSNEEIQEMIKFYNKLLKIVDKALGYKYSSQNF
jgi:hypothetical protein